MGLRLMWRDVQRQYRADGLVEVVLGLVVGRVRIPLEDGYRDGVGRT